MCVLSPRLEGFRTFSRVYARVRVCGCLVGLPLISCTFLLILFVPAALTDAQLRKDSFNYVCAPRRRFGINFFIFFFSQGGTKLGNLGEKSRLTTSLPGDVCPEPVPKRSLTMEKDERRDKFIFFQAACSLVAPRWLKLCHDLFAASK